MGGKWSVGDACEVWFALRGKWLRGFVCDIGGGEVRVCDTPEGMSERGWGTWALPKFVRPLTYAYPWARRYQRHLLGRTVSVASPPVSRGPYR